MDIVLLICIGIAATFVGTMAGSGGLINFPAMLLLGIPVHSAIAANKFSNTLSSFSTFLTLLKEKKISIKMVFVIIPFPILGGICGGMVASSLSEEIMMKGAIVLLSFAVVLTFVRKPALKKAGEVKIPKKLLPGLFGVGAYDGMFGPGQGTLLMQLFFHAGIPYLSAIALTRFNTFLSCLGAFVTYLVAGRMVWSVAIPLAVGSFIGAQLGVRIAHRLSARHVKRLLQVVTVLLIFQLGLRIF